MIKTYKYKFYHSKKNKELLEIIDLFSEVWNYFIWMQKMYYKHHKKYINKSKMDRMLTRLKSRGKKHWNKLPSQALQDVTSRIDKGYKKFFDWCKTRKGIKYRPPKFKKKFLYKSFTLKQAGWSLLTEQNSLDWKKKKHQGSIRIGSKTYKFHLSRKIEGNIKTVTIKRDRLGDIYLFFACELEKEIKIIANPSNSCGNDFGLKVFLTNSEKEDIISPLFFKRSIKEIKKAHKKLSRKEKGSNQRKKARLALARLYKRIENQRLDFQFKEALKLVKEFDYLFFETLNLEAMKKLWGRKVSDLAFYQFMKILEFKAMEYGKVLHKIDRWSPTTRECVVCDTKKEMPLKEREFYCTHCGLKMPRDKHSSFKIKKVGLIECGYAELAKEYVNQIVDGASSISLGDVRREQSTIVFANSV